MNVVRHMAAILVAYIQGEKRARDGELKGRDEIQHVQLPLDPPLPLAPTQIPCYSPSLPMAYPLHAGYCSIAGHQRLMLLLLL